MRSAHRSLLDRCAGGSLSRGKGSLVRFTRVVRHVGSGSIRSSLFERGDKSDIKRYISFLQVLAMSRPWMRSEEIVPHQLTIGDKWIVRSGRRFARLTLATSAPEGRGLREADKRQLHDVSMHNELLTFCLLSLSPLAQHPRPPLHPIEARSCNTVEDDVQVLTKLKFVYIIRHEGDV
jgi:hypothetical protein